MRPAQAIDHKLSKILLIVHTCLTSIPVFIMVIVLGLSAGSWDLYGKNDPELYYQNVTWSLISLAVLTLPTIVAWVLLFTLRRRVRRQWWIPASVAALTFFIIVGNLIRQLLS